LGKLRVGEVRDWTILKGWVIQRLENLGIVTILRGWGTWG